jgi:hypothetical protein
MILTSILGVITGLGGSIATGIMNIKTQKLKNDHDIAMIQAETSAMIEETKAKITITETEVAGELAKADQESFDTSQKLGNRVNINNSIIERLFERNWTTIPGVLIVFLLALVDVLRSGMRPAITITLMIVTTYLTYNSIEIVVQNGDVFTPEQVFEMMNNIVYLTITVISWWFGNRAQEKFKVSK